MKVIHRHIGGLESKTQGKQVRRKIHRHIGGLEKDGSPWTHRQTIHRHIGGLENFLTVRYPSH